MRNSTLALIPARGGSKRIFRKNIREFCGKPIIAYSISAACNSELFDSVIVSTDDLEIQSVAEKYGAQVPFLRYPETANDQSTVIDVLNETLSRLESIGRTYEDACCIYATAPFINQETLKLSYVEFVKSQSDTMLAVMKYDFPIQRALKIDNGNKLTLIDPKHQYSRSQDLDLSYHDAGQFFWFKVKEFMQNKGIFTGNICPFIISSQVGQDIDTPADWEIAEVKYKNMFIRSNK